MIEFEILILISKWAAIVTYFLIISYILIVWNPLPFLTIKYGVSIFQNLQRISIYPYRYTKDSFLRTVHCIFLVWMTIIPNNSNNLLINVFYLYIFNRIRIPYGTKSHRIMDPIILDPLDDVYSLQIVKLFIFFYKSRL